MILISNGKRDNLMKRFFCILFTVSLLFVLCSCGREHEVTFASLGDSITVTQRVNEKIKLPEAPTREGYVFDGWFYDAECTKPLGAYDTVAADITLYAGWRFDYERAANRIFESSVKMNVSIYTVSYNTSFGRVTEEVSANGSGIIIKETDSCYYCLTNNHVVEKEGGYSKVKYTVTDCYENPYTSVTLLASSPEYDLALLRFEKGEDELAVVEFASASAEVGDIVISLGQPEGLKNAVTFGIVADIGDVALNSGSDKSTVDFPVLHHTAPVKHGSSGGALLNERFELIGVNYAVATDIESGDFLYGFAIPLEKALEFLYSVS